MGITSASAPGKLILCGEHAVVYGRPAIAVPLTEIRAEAHIVPMPPGSGLRLIASDVNREWVVDDMTTDPLGKLVLATLHHLNLSAANLTITLNSAIPIASGMGSGAAVATALVRALSNHFSRKLPPEEVSSLVYISEQRYHGTPSGIDNTVVAYEQPIWFVKSHAQSPEQQAPSPQIERLTIGTPLFLVIGDTGVRSKTHMPVSNLRQRWQEHTNHYESLFDQVTDVVHQIRDALIAGDSTTIGALLNRNHSLLQELGISSPELDHLVKTARLAGALGAKLSGGGWGGIMVALTDKQTMQPVAAALRATGAAQVVETTVGLPAREPATQGLMV